MLLYAVKDGRIIAELALRCHAASIIIGHNHPGGSPLPSPKDIIAASRIRDAMKVIDTKLIDFVIVGEGGETYSLTGGGLLS